MSPWIGTIAQALRVLETAFWSPGLSRHAMADQLAFSRSKANEVIASLLVQPSLSEGGLRASTGGRWPESLRLHDYIGVILGVDMDAASIDVSLLRMDLTVLEHCGETADVRQGTGPILGRVRQLMHELLARAGREPTQVLSIGVGVPGPVDFASGQLVNPTVTPNWEGFSVCSSVREDFAAPVFIDNDANLMSLGELRHLRRSLPNFLVLTIGTGIGCIIVCHGAAGDVGHICVDREGPRCFCGNVGCVEAMAAGPAIARMANNAADAGRTPLLEERRSSRGIIEPTDAGHASRSGVAAVSEIIQRAAGLIGQLLAPVINFFNPSHVFLGVGVTVIGPLLLAGIRQSVYRRSLALSTRHPRIQYAPQGAQSGLIGAGVLAMQETLRAKGGAQ